MSDAYYHNPDSVKEYIKLAKDVNANALITILKEYLIPDSTMLELGSGPGTDWRLLNEIYDVTGSDNSLEFLKHIKKNNPNGNFLNLDAVTIPTSTLFDSIFSNKVLHHLTNDDLIRSINRQYECLEENGIVCHSFWKGEGDEIFKGLFVNYHRKEELEGYFQSKFDILFLETYQEFSEEDSLFIIARKK